MSLDIGLRPRDAGAAIDPERVLAGCAARRHYARPVTTGASWDVAYHDTETSVRWLLHWDGDALAASLDFVRPTFYALEAMEELVALALALGMVTVVDGEPLDASALVSRWAEGNASAVRALRQHGQTPPYMQPEQALSWWRYTLARGGLARRLGEQVFVPTAMLVLGGERRSTVERLVSWADAMPIVLPVCEHVVLLASTGAQPPYTARLARHEDVVAALDDLLVAAPAAAVEGARMLPPQRGRAAAARLHGVAAEPMHRFDTVAPDGFVDVR